MVFICLIVIILKIVWELRVGAEDRQELVADYRTCLGVGGAITGWAGREMPFDVMRRGRFIWFRILDCSPKVLFDQERV